MKKRYTYAILFGVPGASVSLIAASFVSMIIVVFPLAFAWLNSGDELWPVWKDLMVEPLSFLMFSLELGVFILASLFWVVAGYLVGKKREAEQKSVPKSYYVASLLVTVVLLGFFLLRFVRQNQICRDLCVQNGMSGNMIGLSPANQPPIICSCLDERNQRWVEVGEIGVQSVPDECSQDGDCVGMDWENNQPIGCTSWDFLSRVEYEKGHIVPDWPCQCLDGRCRSL